MRNFAKWESLSDSTLTAVSEHNSEPKTMPTSWEKKGGCAKEKETGGESGPTEIHSFKF